MSRLRPDRRQGSAQRSGLCARDQGRLAASSHVEHLLAAIPPHCGLVAVIDGHPATLAWLGGVHGHRTRSLGVEHFGQTGTVADLYRHFGIDAQAIIAAPQSIARGQRIRHLRLFAEAV